MLIGIDINSERPIYLQIRDQVVSGIASGELVEGTALLSARKLGRELGVNYHTVNKAYNLLATEGFVARDSKKRVVVKPHGNANEGFINAWKETESMRIREGIARGLSKKQIRRMFSSLLDEVSR